MLVIFGKILSIFLIIGVGFLANKLNALPKEANPYLVNLLILVTTPCMIVSSISSKELTSETLGATILSLVGAALFFFAATIIGYFFCKKILKINPVEDIGTYIFIFTTVNSGFMGFPITLALFGKDILYLMVIGNIMLTVYLYPFGAIVLNLGTSNGKVDTKSILNSFKNPCTIAAFLGIAMLFAGVHFPKVIGDCLESIGDSTIPLSMLLVGLQLGESNIGRIVKNRKLIAISFLKMITLPILTFLAVNWLPVSQEIKIVLIFTAVFPSAVAIAPIATIHGKNSLLCAEGIALTTLISLATIPLSALFIFSYYGL